jgi:hypothetical protein|tara:strand:- start:189 stop:530 length:342 start_codon:yes stop_codon:yes gene_type:complete
METTEDFKRDDAFQSQWEMQYDDARDDCMTEADNILMEVEHLVHDLDQTLKVEDVLTLSEAILKVSNLRYFDFTALVDGKYNVYEETFSYDFTEQIKDVLQDRLSFELKIGAK